MSKNSDENYTPANVIETVEAVLGVIDLDPCSPSPPVVPCVKHFTLEDDCLTQTWEGRVFLNPPYSNPHPFLDKLCQSLLAGTVPEAIALLKSGTQHNKKTGKLIHDYASAVCQWGAGKESRIGFINASGEQRTNADFDCIAVYFGHSWPLFEHHFSKHGHVMATRRTIRSLLGTGLQTIQPLPVTTP